MRRLALLALSLCPCAIAFADDPPPVEMGALVRGFALPALGRTEVLPSGGLKLRLYLNDTNEYTAHANDSEAIILDGEVTQLSYDLHYGITDHWEAGLFVPVLSQGGGVLDTVIQGWHRLWGLPNGGREDVPKNAYQYQYTLNGQQLLNVNQGSVTFGDIRLSTGYQIADHLVARAMLQLPTGDASHLSGNGAFGGAAWLDGGLPLGGYFSRLTLYGSAGYSYTGSGDVLPGMQEHGLPFGSVGMGLRITPNWDARLQVYVHAAPYKNSQLAALDHIAAPLTVSTSYRISRITSITLGFQEKASVAASPDFGVFMGVSLN